MTSVPYVPSGGVLDLPAAHHPRLHPGHHLRRLRAPHQQSECASYSVYYQLVLPCFYSLLISLLCPSVGVLVPMDGIQGLGARPSY
jgi:hypothetical protein